MDFLVTLIVFCKILFTVAQELGTTLKTVFVETTTEVVTIITDIPQSDVEIALNQDYGTYTTMSFSYINNQYDKLQAIDKCYDDYTKCLITQVAAHPVCVVNDPDERPDGYATYDSICDVYFDNCQRKMRFWRILNYGRCEHSRFMGNPSYFDIKPTRRLFKNLPLFLKQLFGSI